ncbi:MAG: YesL family protein [Eubacterium sp.]|nr:YesL family protein [Eubacterium sp.]
MTEEAREESRDTQNSSEREFWLKRAMDKLGIFFGLNLCFIFTSIPIFTIGASLSALYTMAIKLQKGEEETIWAGYKAAFKKNFKQATIAWLIMIFIGVAIFGQILLINLKTGAVANFYKVFIVVEMVFASFEMAYLFPLIARFENSLYNTFKNAILISITDLWSFIKIFLSWFAPIFFSIRYPMIFICTWWVWLVFLIGMIAYLNSLTIVKVFNRVSDVKEQVETEKEEKKKEKERLDIKKHGSIASYNKIVEESSKDDMSN